MIAIGNEKSAQGRHKHCVRAGCSKAEPKKNRPAADPFPGARDGQNLISWRWTLPLSTNPLWLGSMHAISSYRGDRPPTHTNRQDRLQYTAPQLARSVKINPFAFSSSRSIIQYYSSSNTGNISVRWSL